MVVLRYNNLHIVVQRLHIPCGGTSNSAGAFQLEEDEARQPTGVGVVERPEVLLEVEVGEEDAHPDPEVELGVGLAARVQHGAAHPGHQQHRLPASLLAVVIPDPSASAAPAVEAAAAAAEHADAQSERRAEHGGALALAAARRAWGASAERSGVRVVLMGGRRGAQEASRLSSRRVERESGRGPWRRGPSPGPVSPARRARRQESVE